jgi:integrase
MIKENLGHASVLTTENYLDDFEDEVKKEYARKLTDL